MVEVLEKKIRNDAKRLKDNVYWDNQSNSYRYKKSNRALSSKQVYRIVMQEIQRYEEKVAKLSERFVNGSIPFEEWQFKMSELTRDSHVNLLRFGRGGKEKTYAVQYLAIGRELKDVHYSALSNFSREIAEGKLTQRQIVARAKLYARSARVSFEYGRLTLKNETVNYRARRKLGNCSPHCEPCQVYSRLGWVPLSRLILPTKQCDCRVNCCCSVEYQKV